MATTLTVTPWDADTALAGFEARTLTFPADDEGPVIATLVRRRAAAPSGRAALYIHGFVDYFFQTHLAEAFNTRGYHFYALDLRKCGRSLRPGQTPHFCTDLRDYYAELDAAITLIFDEEDRPWLLLDGHSTGGLIAALYAHEGRWRERVKALFLNSPFFAFYLPRRRMLAARLFAALGRWRPRLASNSSVSPFYAHSLHRNYYGEWEFNLNWKPIEGFPAYAGWMRAVMRGQRRLQAGLEIACPVLIMHSTRSLLLSRWDERLLRADAVLNVAHMRRYGPGLGPRVTLIAIEGGMHDLTLSAAPVRARVFEELFAWLEWVTLQGRRC